MKKVACVFLFMSIFVFTASAQLSYSRTHKLKTPGISKDTLYKRVKYDLDFIKPAKGDTIADLGTYDGLYPAMYSVFSDSVTFYLEDVNTRPLFFLDSLKMLCASISNKQITNTFLMFEGTQTYTNLPAQKFDKVILRDVVHHCQSSADILAEACRILAPGGKLILFEPVVPAKGKNEKLCVGAFTMKQLMALTKEQDLKLVRKKQSQKDHYWFEFVKK
ncbi:MAG TPA: methyltransferase domain-containing protein [Flavobacteriales bacterium]|nr:methyltransferase domain-containing protein [Flavobacteriales bacterium]